MWKATNLRSICFLEKTQQNHLLLKRAKDLGVSKVLHDRELRSYRSGLQVHLSLLPPPGLTELLKSYLPNRKGVSSNFQPPFYEGLCETSGVKTCFFWGVGNLCAERAGWSNLAILPKGRNFGWLVDMSMIRSHGDVCFFNIPQKRYLYEKLLGDAMVCNLFISLSYCTMTLIILWMVAGPPSENLCVSYEFDCAT